MGQGSVGRRPAPQEPGAEPAPTADDERRRRLAVEIVSLSDRVEELERRLRRSNLELAVAAILGVLGGSVVFGVTGLPLAAPTRDGGALTAGLGVPPAAGDPAAIRAGPAAEAIPALDALPPPAPRQPGAAAPPAAGPARPDRAPAVAMPPALPPEERPDVAAAAPKEPASPPPAIVVATVPPPRPAARAPDPVATPSSPVRVEPVRAQEPPDPVAATPPEPAIPEPVATTEPPRPDLPPGGAPPAAAAPPGPVLAGLAEAADRVPGHPSLYVSVTFARQDAGAAERATALARRLRNGGFTVGDPTPIARRAITPGISYFFLEDRDGAARVEAALDGRLGLSSLVSLASDVTPPRPGTILVSVPSS